MRRSTGAWIVAGALAVGAVVVAWPRHRDVPAAPSAAESSSPAALPTAAGTDPASAATTGPGAGPQPTTPAAVPPPAVATAAGASDGLPVNLRIVALEEAARAGDTTAACEVAAELLRCRMIRGWTESSDRYHVDQLARMDLDDAQLDAATRQLAESIAHNKRIKQECELVPETSLRAIGYHTLASARAGNVASMLHFAQALGIGGEEIVADPQLYALYRTHGWGLFLQAFEAGEPGAATAWHHALHSQGFSFLAGLMPPDWRTPEVAAALSRRLSAALQVADVPPPPLAGAQPPHAAPEAEATAEALFERHFADSPRVRRRAEEIAQLRAATDVDMTAPEARRMPRMRKFGLNDDHCAQERG